MHSYVQCVLWCKSSLINSAPGITACLKCSRPYNNCAFQLRVDINNAPFENAHFGAIVLLNQDQLCMSADTAARDTTKNYDSRENNIAFQIRSW